MSHLRRSTTGRRGILVSFGIAGAGVAAAAMLAASAIACTETENTRTIVVPSSGSSGQPLAVSTWADTVTNPGLPANTGGFTFRYKDIDTTSVLCHHASSIGASESTDANGDIGSAVAMKSRTIPNLGRGGGIFLPAKACWSNATSASQTGVYSSIPTNIVVN